MAFSPLNQRLAEQGRHRENRGRLGHAYARFTTTGVGTFEFEDRVEFGMTFVERPFIATGYQIDVDAAEEAAGTSASVYRLPLVTSYITEWDLTDRDHYIGCWVATVIYLPDYEGASPQVRLHHDFTWSGIALKDVPSDV